VGESLFCVRWCNVDGVGTKAGGFRSRFALDYALLFIMPLQRFTLPSVLTLWSPFSIFPSWHFFPDEYTIPFALLCSSCTHYHIICLPPFWTFDTFFLAFSLLAQTLPHVFILIQRKSYLPFLLWFPRIYIYLSYTNVRSRILPNSSCTYPPRPNAHF